MITNKTFTDEQMTNLRAAEPYFDSVINHSTLRNAPRLLTQTVATIYTQATGKYLSKNYSCSTCAYNIYKTVGKLYFQQVDQLKNENYQQLEQGNSEQKIEPLEQNEEKPKRTRTKKSKA